MSAAVDHTLMRRAFLGGAAATAGAFLLGQHGVGVASGATSGPPPFDHVVLV
jgi:hypothetical protein